MRKGKIKWSKGSDPFDGSPRYTFEGRDPSFTASTIAVVITTEKKRKYAFDPHSTKNFYTGYVYHLKKEYSDTTKEFETLKECKAATEMLFSEYCELFPDDTEAW